MANIDVAMTHDLTWPLSVEWFRHPVQDYVFVRKDWLL
jgi:hypothetical protein